MVSERIRSNLRELTLSPGDVEKISAIAKTEGQRWFPQLIILTRIRSTELPFWHVTHRFVLPIRMGMNIDVFGTEEERQKTKTQVMISCVFLIRVLIHRLDMCCSMRSTRSLYLRLQDQTFRRAPDDHQVDAASLSSSRRLGNKL